MSAARQGDALGQVVSWAMWEQRLTSAGQQMTSRGWALHVTEQLEMPSGDVAWSGTLAYRDRVVATVEQSGAGGAPLIRWGLGALAPTLAELDPHPRHRDLWERDLAAAGTDEETAISGLDQVDVISTPPPAGQAAATVDSVALSIDTITGGPDRNGAGERWAVTGRVDVLGVAHDFTYAYQDHGQNSVADQTLTVTREGVDQGYDGWQWGEPPPSSATLIARRVEHEWLVDVIREASVQKVWDARFDAERAAVGTISGTTTHVGLPEAPGAAFGGVQRTANVASTPATPVNRPAGPVAEGRTR